MRLSVLPTIRLSPDAGAPLFLQQSNRLATLRSKAVPVCKRLFCRTGCKGYTAMLFVIVPACRHWFFRTDSNRLKVVLFITVPRYRRLLCRTEFSFWEAMLFMAVPLCRALIIPIVFSRRIVISLPIVRPLRRLFITTRFLLACPSRSPERTWCRIPFRQFVAVLLAVARRLPLSRSPIV